MTAIVCLPANVRLEAQPAELLNNTRSRLAVARVAGHGRIMVALPSVWPGSAPVLSAAEMRAAELMAAAQGISLSSLMNKAGAALADIIVRVAAGRDVLVMAGPGNNGGDGYVAARLAAARGTSVRVAALGSPCSDLAQAAAAAWQGPVEQLTSETRPSPVLVDALLGTGGRPLQPDVYAVAHGLCQNASRVIAADLPSGIDADSGLVPGPALCADITLALGALKPAHLLFPAAAHCGKTIHCGLGLSIEAQTYRLGFPDLPAPSADAHKYRRGMVGILGGRMAGAAELAARAALRSGAGYVQLLGSRLPATGPFAIVRRGMSHDTELDSRIDAVVIGPGLVDGSKAMRLLSAAVDNGVPVVADAEAIPLFRAMQSATPAILTPHGGEFARHWPTFNGDKLSATRAAAQQAGAVVVHKGADTVIADPDGRAIVAANAPHWLATAGSGDVLAGICGAMLARGLEPFAAACAAVALHNRAAQRARPGFAADDLVAGPIWP
jgi:hydroxyethylthiazole kinase-like uncharacterized protein yjeF